MLHNEARELLVHTCLWLVMWSNQRHAPDSSRTSDQGVLSQAPHRIRDSQKLLCRKQRITALPKTAWSPGGRGRRLSRPSPWWPRPGRCWRGMPPMAGDSPQDGRLHRGVRQSGQVPVVGGHGIANPLVPRRHKGPLGYLAGVAGIHPIPHLGLQHRWPRPGRCWSGTPPTAGVSGRRCCPAAMAATWNRRRSLSPL